MEEKLIQEVFKNHKATLKDLGEVKILDWVKDGTREHSIKYIILEGRKLIVTGDYWNAIYVWSGNITFKAVAGYDLGYFASKFSMLSESCPHDWDDEKALNTFKEHVLRLNLFEDDEERKDLFEEAKDASVDEYSWVAFIRKVGDSLNDDEGYLFAAGNKLSSIIEIHHAALKLAVKQLKAESEGQNG